MSKKIKTTELDFDSIKNSLKEYLRGQQQFSDFDFDGSGLSVLLDVLAYNTHYNALYTNLAINEAFLDSASKRSSVVSKAKEIGYVPRSARSATAKVNVTFTLNNPTAPNVYELPRGTRFSTSINGTTYRFVTADSIIATKSNNRYVFSNVELKEGVNLYNRYTVQPGVKFYIPNQNADLSTLRVRVQEHSQSSVYTTYNPATSLLSVDGDTLVYFVKELADQQYEIEFGNGVVGKALEIGNVVTLDYIVCSGSNANSCKTFSYEGNPIADSTVSVVTVQAAVGGDEPEDIETIKWNAPRAYAAQNRCVTLDDYRHMILQNYPNAQSVNVWGGESNYPPSYGDVFISILPTEGETLSESEKSYLLNDVLGPRRVVTVHPKFVDPSYINLELAVTFYYNPRQTSRSAEDLVSIVKEAVLLYDASTLNKFGAVYKQSALSRAIDLSEQSIVSSVITFKMHREMPVTYNRAVKYTINLGNPIFNAGSPDEAVISTGFFVLGQSETVYIDDVPAENSPIGTLRLFYYNASGRKEFVRNVGTVDYQAGLLQIDDILITNIVGNQLKFVFKGESQDVASVRNQIVSIAPSMMTVTPVIDKSADEYKFTSSRN